MVAMDILTLITETLSTARYNDGVFYQVLTYATGQFRGYRGVHWCSNGLGDLCVTGS